MARWQGVWVSMWLVLDESLAHAQQEPELAELSMEELLDLEVEVASKSKERISGAPASITAWTGEDMDAVGYHTLHELADFTAGYSSTVMYGERVLETRGQKAGSFNNNKHLTYFDGIPINHARSFKAPVDAELPLFAADRVELLRGPASALYGTSAFFGVVNVVPRELVDPGSEVEARLSFGSRDGERQVSAAAYLTDSDGRFRLSLASYDRAASRSHVGLVDDEHNLYWDDQKGVFLTTAYSFVDSPLAGLTVAFLYFRKNGGLGESWNENASSHELNDLTWETIIPYARFRRELAQGVTLSAHLLWNTGREKGWFVNANAMQQDMYEGTGVPLGGYDAHTENLAAQAEVHWKPLARTKLIGGVTGDARQQIGSSRSYGYAVSADPGPPFLQDASVARGSDLYAIYSVYLQIRHELPLLHGLVVTAGARDDLSVSPTQHENQISPRLGLVQRLPWNLSLKLFYGTALRAPGLKEIGLNNESRISLERMGLPTDGIGDLESETIRSVEAGVAYADEHVSLSAAAFANRTERSLDGVTYMGVNIFQNGRGETDSIGSEVEAQVAPWRDLRFLASYAWSEAKDDDGHELEDVPRHKTNLGVIYRWNDLTAAATLRWVSGYRTPHGPDTDGTVLVDANLGWAFSPRFRAELAGRNLLDEDTKLPKHGREDVPQSGIRVLATLIVGY